MFLFFWLEKKIRGGSVEQTLEKMKQEQLKKGLHYTQQSHIKGSQPNKTEEQVMASLIPATYYGNTSEECRHLIISYLEFSQFGKLIEEHPNGYDALAPFEAWWNEYISDEDSFLEEV